MKEDEIFYFKYPKIKPTQKWLEEWWKKNTNTFLYALENEEVKQAIVEYRNYALIEETGTTPEELRVILRRIFLKDCEGGRDISTLKYLGSPVKRVGDDYYIQVLNKKTGVIADGLLDNPFRVFDDGYILRPEAKIQLIEMLADPSKNSWLFEPRYAINEETIVYPSSHNLIGTLHSLHFLRVLNTQVLGRYNLDYFIFWPLFFYYAITNDINFVLKNVNFLHYPIKLFLVEDEWHKVLQFRLYGNCNFNEISNFMKDNKSSLSKINKLMGVTTVTSGEIRDYHIYKTAQKIENPIKLVVELIEKKLIKSTTNSPKNYKEYLKKASIRDGNYRGNNHENRESFKKENNLIKTVLSQVKKEVASFSMLNKYKNIEEVEKLIDSVNKYN